MVKEQGQSTYNALPSQRSPARLIVAMVFAAIYWLNTLHPINFNPHAGMDTGLSDNEESNDVTVMEAAGVAAQPTMAPEVAARVAAPPIEDQAVGMAQDQAQVAEVAEMAAEITAATRMAKNDNDDDTSNLGIATNMDHPHGEREHQSGVRWHKSRGYSHLHHSLGNILNQKLKPQWPKDSSISMMPSTALFSPNTQ